MGGSSKTVQDTQQHQTQDPFAPTIPGLTTGVNQLTQQFGNTGINPTEQGAFNSLSANAAAGNPYAPAIGSLATDLLKGGPDYTGRVNSAFDQFSGSLAPTISGQYLDPSTNPFYQQTSDAATARVRDLTNQMFAGSGGFGGSANQGTLATNVTNALAPIFQNQYNTERQNQLNAINQQFGGANTATGLLSNLSQTSLGNRGAGIEAAQSALGANDSAANQQLAIQAAQRGLPINNINQILAPLGGVGALGGTTDMQGTTTQQTKVPLLQQLIGAAIAISGNAAKAATASDERVKENKFPIGHLADGQTIWSYNYIGDSTPRIGLMAQEVERVNPDAVIEGPTGIKMVRYDKATERSRGILGHL